MLAIKFLRVRIKKDDARSYKCSKYDPRNNKDKGDTSTVTNLEGDVQNNEYHSKDSEVAMKYRLDNDVTTAHDGVNEECQTTVSTKSSSNHWEERYCEIEDDRSEGYHQTYMQKMNTSRLLSKQFKEVFGTQSSEVRSNARNLSSGVSIFKEDMGSKEIRHDILSSKAHEDSNLKEGSRIEGLSTFTDIVETATVKEVTNATAKNIGSKKIKHEECNNYGESIPRGESHANETTAFREVTGVITKETNSKASRHEISQAYKQKLYKDVIRRKQIVRSEQIIDNNKQEASISQLTTILEESEKETETRHTATYNDKNREASTTTTKK